MIGKGLKKIRIEKGLKQEDIAKEIGVNSNTISQYETENRQATFETIEKIATYCNYEIIFRNIKTKKEFNLRDLKREDI